MDLLNKHFQNLDLIIFIEEIPIASEANYEEFSGKIFSLLISKNLRGGLDKIRFVLSSINNPASYIPIFQHKIHHQLVFQPLDYWQIEEINMLIQVIENEFQFTLPTQIRKKLISVSKGSPRFIKKYFRSIYTLNKTDQKTLRFLIEETHRELGEYRNA